MCVNPIELLQHTPMCGKQPVPPNAEWSSCLSGLWSEAGLYETRTAFWHSYKVGKQHAQAGILWDLVWELFRSGE